MMTSSAWGQASADADARKLRDAYVAKYKPLVIASETAWWEASTTGEDAAFEKRKQAQNALVELHSDKAVFAQLKSLREAGQLKDPVLAREIDVMYRSHVPGQADATLQKKIIEIETEVEQIFNAHRGEIDGKPMTENEIRQILKDTQDPQLAEKAWKAYMHVGPKVEQALAAAVELRNRVARELGYKNFFVMKLSLQEIDESELVKLFDELDALTQEPFNALKKEIDAAMAKRFGTSADQLRPWHFGDLFFQEAPGIEEVNLDDVYKNKDLLALAKDYYASLGTPAEDILARSDLYEKPKKSPHAFATNLNRADDIRILCNLQPNLYWADTLIHELGHAVYDKYIGKGVPFILHEASHSLTTEGFAMMVGAVVKNEDFLVKAVKVPPDQAAKLVQSARKSLRAEKLIFTRWTQVMMRFERGMYADPKQNLGKLWWDLKKRYQSLSPPETVDRPDYAAKVHIITHPVYYHSYMMGELFASQLHEHIGTKVLRLTDPTKTSFYGRKEVGDFWKEKVFGPGNLHAWNELTRQATGEHLSAKAFAKLYVKP
jgi:peptidyl-dipeptidase A